YTVSYVPGTFAISKAAATVTAADNAKTYGTADPALTASQSGFTAADAATIALSATRASGENVASYVITSGASGGALSNYTVTYVPGTFVISKAAATVTATNSGKTYGTADPALAATESGFTAADAATIALSATRASGQNVGDYVITASASGAAVGNYTVTYVPGTFAITKAAARLTAARHGKTYGTADPALAASEAGFTAADATTIALSATRGS